MNNKNTNQPASTIYSINKQLIQNIWPFCIVVAILLVLGLISMSALSSVRAYISGESNWSKSHNLAIYHLNRYVKTHAESDYQQFLSELEVPLQDKVARLALQKTKPNIQLAKVAFIKAENNPDDVAGMVKLFLNFQHTSLMRPSIAYWAQGDHMIAQIMQLAKQLHQHINHDDLNEEKINHLMAQVNQINSELAPLENGFFKRSG